MEGFSQWFGNISRSRSVKYGLPFLVFMIGGSYGLKQFSQLRYQYSRKVALKPEDVEPLGIKMKKPGEVTVESEYEKIKDMDIDHWENIRGPRPWEEQPTKPTGK